MPRVGVKRGSNAGIVSRMICHHASGTGGCCQYDGSEYSPECAGMINVPSGVITSSKACTTATDPPFTHPIELNDEWTITTMPACRPSARKSAARVSRVRGVGML